MDEDMKPTKTQASLPRPFALQDECTSDSTAFDTMVAAAKQRLAAIPNTLEETLPPEAIRQLAAEARPVARYLSRRNAREVTMRSYSARLKHVQRLLIEAGMDDAWSGLPVDLFPWHCLTETVARSFFISVTTRFSSPKTSECYLGVVRQMLRECTAAGLLPIASRERLFAHLPVRARHRPPAGRALTDEEVTRLLDCVTSGDDYLDRRDAAMIAVFLSAGVRVSELVEIEMADLDIEERSIIIHRTKPGRPLVVWLTPGALQPVQRWIDARGTHCGALFDKERQPGAGLLTDTVRSRLHERRREAGITQRFSTHDFRRTFVTRALRAGVDPFRVARLVGHVRITTTLAYDRRTFEEDRAAVDRLGLPGFGFAGEAAS